MNPPDVTESPRLSAAMSEAYRRDIGRLPLTMRPALNQQLHGWANLFPYEQNRFREFLAGVASFSPAQWDALTAPLRALEAKMRVSEWRFSETSDTMENASLLARSSYYAEWRHEVQKVFAAIESAARASAAPKPAAGRLVVLTLPQNLPVRSIMGSKPWDPRAVEYKIDGDPERVHQLAIDELPTALAAQGNALAKRGADAEDATPDCWVIDADAKQHEQAGPGYALDYALLRPFRDEFLSQVNTVPKDIEGTDHILARVRQENWDKLWPVSLAGQTRLRSFVIELFLSGNGALIFPNSFVQWASTEALRRARPRLLMARFGMRSRPKPFTGIAIFENQQKVSAMRDVDDPEGSAVDALMLARYVWLSAMRFPEQEHTSCLCVAESSRTMCVIAPQKKMPPWRAGSAVPPEEAQEWMKSQLTEA
jgi:hypothetical protein